MDTFKQLNPRVKCRDGVSLSVQAGKFHYCTPRIDGLETWQDYEEVEVGFVEKDCAQFTPSDSFRPYSDGGEFPSPVYGYVPTRLVKEFIEEHGGEIIPTGKESA